MPRPRGPDRTRRGRPFNTVDNELPLQSRRQAPFALQAAPERPHRSFRPMNILYLNSHDTGRVFSPYGHQVRTPNVQRLAEQGVLFRNAHAAAPTCSPSRVALCSGQYPHCIGMIGLGNRGIPMAHPERHMANLFKANGFETAGSDNHTGVNKLGKTPKDLGYEKELTWNDVDGAVAYLKSKPAKPFFMSLSFGRTHRKSAGFASDPDPASDDPRYVRPPAPLADTPEIRADWAHFLTDCHDLDADYGKVLDALDEAGLAEDTLVVATTDHGPAFPGMKCNLTQHGTGVALVVRGPGGFTGGKVVDQLVSQIDLFPTLCELAEIDAPPWLQGRSLLPLLGDSPPEQIHDEIFAEVSYHAAYQPMRAVRTPRYVYVRRFGERLRAVTPNVDASPSKDAWLARGYAERPLDREMLFDAFFDPEETNNLAGNPNFQHLLGEMRERLDRWMQATDDPLLKPGRVPLPPTGWESLQEIRDPGQFPRETLG